jgi:catechol 2,3-dioxygenase-like lactoylglutathione lyase family enzyme
LDLRGWPIPGGNPVTAEDPMMVGAVTVSVVTDIAKSTEHYRDVLGFTVTFEYGTPTFYVCLCRDEVALHLLSASQTSRLSGNGGICVFVRDVDAVYAELAARGARIVEPPQNYDYGMRDFDLIDLDGNQPIESGRRRSADTATARICGRSSNDNSPFTMRTNP